MIGSSNRFEGLVRAGFLSRAVLYSVLGLIALTNVERIGSGADGIFRAIWDFPLGTVILWLMVVGLAGYALFRLASAIFDIEHHGSDKRGRAERLGHAGSGIGHLALAWSAARFAMEGHASGDGAERAAAGILSVDLGGLVLGLLGLAFVAAAIFQAKKGISGSFMQRIAAGAPRATRALGGMGYAARAVVFALIGWSLIEAGLLEGGSGQVMTLGDAVASLAGEGILFTLVAAGLLLFGVFSLVLARWRIIPSLEAGIPRFRA